MDRKEPRKRKLTASEIDASLKDMTDEICKKVLEVKQLYSERIKHLDNIQKNAESSKDKFIWQNFKAILEDLITICTNEAVTTILVTQLLFATQSMDQMQVDIEKIKETHSPIIDMMKEAIERQRKFLRDNT